MDPKELAEHPLRVGLSMEAQVDVLRGKQRVLERFRDRLRFYADALAGADGQTDRQIILRAYCRVLVDLGLDREADSHMSPLASSASRFSKAWLATRRKPKRV